LQGIAFVERLCFDYLDWLGADVNGRLTLTGGGARNRYWCQLRADVLDRPVTLVENAEPALGMAILAAAQGKSLAEVAGTMVTIRETIDPRPDHHRRFCEPYLRLIDELARRGWLPAPVTEHATKRINR
jgi:sugar (pentulose or hexulose) kinase